MNQYAINVVKELNGLGFGELLYAGVLVLTGETKENAVDMITNWKNIIEN